MQTSRLRSSLLCGLVVTLALVVVAQLTRISERLSVAPLEPGAHKIYELSDETRNFIAQLDDEILLTYYTSPHSVLPSRLRHLREDVELVLRRIAEASGGQIHAEIVVPAERPELREYLTELGLSSFRARRVEQDGWSEAELWSSLRISRGAAPDAILHAVTPEMVRGLQDLIVEQARAQATREPLRPRVTLAAATGQFKSLEQLLEKTAEVTRIDLDAEPSSLPLNSDLLFWMDPTGGSPAHLRALTDHVERGRPAVLAAAPIKYATRRAELGTAVETLFAEFGVVLAPGVLRDAQSHAAALRCTAHDQDFRPLGAQPNGSLSFEGAGILQLDAQGLLEQARTAHALATATEVSVLRVQHSAETGVEHHDSTRSPGEDEDYTEALGPRSPLLLLLDSENPEHGKVVLSASSTPFSDTALADDASANRGLARILVDELADPSKLVSNRAFVAGAERFAELSESKRSLWRGITIFGLPAACLLLALVRFARRRSTQLNTGRPLALGLGLTFAISAGATWLVSFLNFQLDSTADRVHSISVAEQQVIERAIAGKEDARIELCFSPASELPPELQLPVRRTRDVCEELARRVSGLETVSPSLDQVEGDKQLAPRLVISRNDEGTRVRRVVAALRIRLGSKSSVLRLTEEADYENLRFRIAFAFWRLSEGRPIRVAIAADSGRLSAAEDEFDYRAEGLFAPTEGDRFGYARELLAHNDFELVALDPSAPTTTSKPNLTLWLAPRRDIGPMLNFATQSLTNGGNVLIAAQHFEILPRQLQRDGMQLSFWPRPQHNDLERDYFPGLGIDLKRELFFDRESAPITLPTRIERRLEQSAGGHELESQFSAQPFIVRALASKLGVHPITNGLGDLLLPSPNKFGLSKELLARYGLEPTPLVYSTENVWHHDWTGGNLDRALLEGPVTSADTDMPFERRLAVLFEGRFPVAQFKREQLPNGAELDFYAPGPPHENPSGKLLFAGSSSMFEDAALANSDFDNGQFLLHSVINLTLGDELTQIASRRLATSGFERPDSGERIYWRIWVLGAGPLAGLLLVLGLSVARGRSARARISPQ